jgi:hypothetical protein
MIVDVNEGIILCSAVNEIMTDDACVITLDAVTYEYASLFPQ